MVNGGEFPFNSVKMYNYHFNLKIPVGTEYKAHIILMNFEMIEIKYSKAISYKLEIKKLKYELLPIILHNLYVRIPVCCFFIIEEYTTGPVNYIYIYIIIPRFYAYDSLIGVAKK